MAKATIHEIQVPRNRGSSYEAGIADGEECRRRKGKPSVFVLVALNDDYSAGFRAGFFQRALSKARITNTAT